MRKGIGLVLLVATFAGVSFGQGSNGARKIIIDEDSSGPARSNLQAILMLLQATDVEVLGITVTSGDGWRDENIAHLLRLLEIAQRPEIPVYAGAVHPLVNSEKKTEAWESLYGKLYYKGAWTKVWPDADVVKRAPYHPYDVVPELLEGKPSIQAAAGSGIEFMIRKVHEFPGQVTIWAGAGLTDLALAARLDPQFASLAKELVFMGGSFNPAPADNEFANEYIHSPRREFNMRWDPEAASIVLHEPWKKITQLPVDPTTKTLFKREFFEQIADGKAPFAAYLARFGEPFPMWDELTAAIWLDPSIVTESQEMLVDVNPVFGPTYGDTLSWPLEGGPGLGERPVTVIKSVDLPRFEKMTVELLTRESRTGKSSR